MAWLKNYVNTLAATLIFTSFLGLILPGGKYKQYIKMVTGLAIILAIISPAAKLINSGSGFDSLLKQAGINLNMNIASKEKAYYDDQMLKTVIETYSNDIISQMAVSLHSFNYEIENANIQVNDSDENFGMIEYIDLTLTKNQSSKAESLIKIDKVSVENIAGSHSQKEDSNSEEINNIKNFLSDFYNLSVDNIHIKVSE